MLGRLEKFLKARLAIEFRLMQEENKKLRYKKHRTDWVEECQGEAKIEQRNDEYLRMNGKLRQEIPNQGRLVI